MAMWPTHRSKASQQRAKANWLKKQRRLARKANPKNTRPESVNDSLV